MEESKEIAQKKKKRLKPHVGFKSNGSNDMPWNNVLFYGDSITWGMAHDYTGRYGMTWPRLLTERLAEYHLIPVESALCSRTTCWDDKGNDAWMTGAEPHYFNGLKHLYPELISATPTWLVLLLGTNDLRAAVRMEAKRRTRIDAYEIARNCAKIALQAREVQRTCQFLPKELQIVMVAPPTVCLNQLSAELGYDETSVSIASDFTKAYKEVCDTHGFLFVDCEKVDMKQSVDGVHITEEANTVIADAVWKVLRPRLGPPTNIVSRKSQKRMLSSDEVTKLKPSKKAMRKTPKVTSVNTKPKVSWKNPSGKSGGKGLIQSTKEADEELYGVKFMIKRRSAEVLVVEFLVAMHQRIPAVFEQFVKEIQQLPGRNGTQVDRSVKRMRDLLKNDKFLLNSLNLMLGGQLQDLRKQLSVLPVSLEPLSDEEEQEVSEPEEVTVGSSVPALSGGLKVRRVRKYENGSLIVSVTL